MAIPSGPSLHNRTPAEQHAADRALMCRIAGGDEAAFDEVVKRYWEPLLRYAHGFVSSQDEAEDAVQNVFIRVWEVRGTWASNDSLRGYLYSALRNRLLNEKRAAKIRLKSRDRVQRKTQRTQPTPLDFAEEGELVEAVRSALDGLSPRRQEVFTLARFHGLSHAEIAETLQVSSQAVSNYMSAALSRLRDELAEFIADDSPQVPFRQA